MTTNETIKVKPNRLPFTCPNCGGRGTVGYEKRICVSCKGKGVILVDQKDTKEYETY